MITTVAFWLLAAAAALQWQASGPWSSFATGSKPASVAGVRLAPVKYRIDAASSRFTVKAFTGGLFGAFGHDHTIAIRDFAGEAQFLPETLEQASLVLTIKADSLAVIDKVSDKDKREIEATMRDKVLETSKYPEILFRSTSVSANKLKAGEYEAKIWGELSLHGVVRNGLIYAKVSLVGNTLRATGGFPLRQTDYSIKPVSVAAGTIKVKDELKLSFDIRATKVGG